MASTDFRLLLLALVIAIPLGWCAGVAIVWIIEHIARLIPVLIVGGFFTAATLIVYPD